MVMRSVTLNMSHAYPPPLKILEKQRDGDKIVQHLNYFAMFKTKGTDGKEGVLFGKEAMEAQWGALEEKLKKKVDDYSLDDVNGLQVFFWLLDGNVNRKIDDLAKTFMSGTLSKRAREAKRATASTEEGPWKRARAKKPKDKDTSIDDEIDTYFG